jgi:hypothetical protein
VQCSFPMGLILSTTIGRTCSLVQGGYELCLAATRSIQKPTYPFVIGTSAVVRSCASIFEVEAYAHFHRPLTVPECHWEDASFYAVEVAIATRLGLVSVPRFAMGWWRTLSMADGSGS